MKNIFLLLTFLIGIFESQAQVMFQKYIEINDNDCPRSVTNCNDGGYLIGGYSDLSQNYHMFMTKLNINGDTSWTRNYSGTSNELLYECGQTSDGGYFIAGTVTNPTNATGDFLLAKTDSSGFVLWSNFYGMASNDGCWSAVETSDSGFILLGEIQNSSQSILIIKIDASGLVDWAKNINTIVSDHGSDVIQTNDGGYIITGFSYSFGAGLTDIYLIKADASLLFVAYDV